VVSYSKIFFVFFHFPHSTYYNKEILNLLFIYFDEVCFLDKHFVNVIKNNIQNCNELFDISHRFKSAIDAKHIHFIGIGGSGMYPLAQILHGAGYFLTGSDNNLTETVEAVRKMGIKVNIGHDENNLDGCLPDGETARHGSDIVNEFPPADMVIYTAAIPDSNPELRSARERGLRVLERSELLGLLTNFYKNTIGVSGTHGKTTVTSMITEIFVTGTSNESLRDITAVIGGKLASIGGSGICGKSETFVVESCEFKDHFLKLSPDITLINNIDADHMDYFGDMETLKASFAAFASKATTAVIANMDDKNTMDAISNLNVNLCTFGYNKLANYRPENVQIINPMFTTFDIIKNEDLLCSIELHVPGRHNILNAVAAAAAADLSGVEPDGIAKGLASFRGSGRRFEKYGEVNGITVVDDYGHHPTEIRVTLEAAAAMGYNRVFAVHQPFTFTRTKTHLAEFAKVLSIADKVVLTAIMGGREENTVGVHTADLAALIPGAVWFEDEDHDRNFDLASDYVAANAAPGDLIITLGCGDVNKLARQILVKLSEKNKATSGN
jgi:UDP-N-acetylmuramate--alanine ligase